MRRIKLVVAYDGTSYCGWQIQPNVVTVEGILNQVLSELLHERIQVIGASRTDSGVHALGNIAVFDTNSRIPGEKFAYALNQRLPEDIRIQESCEVQEEFHPRHCVSWKTYEYRIVNARFQDPTRRFYTHFVHRELSVEKMQEAANYLIGEHDFQSFCSVQTQVNSTVRTIYNLTVAREEKEVIIRVTGNGFLYNMVRIIAGTLIAVGQGLFDVKEVHIALEAKDREQAGPTAPAKGLCLMEIKYENDMEIEDSKNL